MENEEGSQRIGPLDSFEKTSVQQTVALQWLMIYAAYFLLTRIIYVFVFPILISANIIDSENTAGAYKVFNTLSSLGHIAIAIAVMVKINHTLCRILFAGIALLDFYTVILLLLMPR